MWCWLVGHDPELLRDPDGREGRTLIVVCTRCPAAGTWNDSLVWHDGTRSGTGKRTAAEIHAAR